MKGMILVAGEGLRARPLTDFYAKPALPIPGGTIITHLLQQLKNSDVAEIALNLHYLPSTIMDAIEEYPVWNVRINPFDEPALAGSGGGFYRIREFFNEETFLIVNGDTISNIDIRAMVEFHNQKKNMATFLAVPDETGSARVIDTDESGKITAIRKQPEKGLYGFTWKFCGAMVVDRGLFQFFQEATVIDLFDDVLIPLLNEGRFSGSVYSSSFKCLEFGTPSDYYKSCYNYLESFFPGSEAFGEYEMIEGGFRHRESLIAGGLVNQNSFIGKGSLLEQGSEITRTIVYKATISRNARLENSIILADFIPDGFICQDCVVLPDLRKIEIMR